MPDVHGWFYSLVSGELLKLNEEESAFQEVCD